MMNIYAETTTLNLKKEENTMYLSLNFTFSTLFWTLNLPIWVKRPLEK